MVWACLLRRAVLMLSCSDSGLPSMALKISSLHRLVTERSAFSAEGVISVSCGQ